MVLSVLQMLTDCVVTCLIEFVGIFLQKHIKQHVPGLN